MIADAVTDASDGLHELRWHGDHADVAPEAVEAESLVPEPAEPETTEFETGSENGIGPVVETHAAVTHAVWSAGPNTLQVADPADDDIWIIDLDALDAAPPMPSTAPASLQAATAAAEPALAAPPLPTPPPVDADTVSEITAAVGAHLAIDIALEVEQRVKQQMATVMNSVYNDLLQRLGHDIASELEAQLAPKISALVQDELRRKRLLD